MDIIWNIKKNHENGEIHISKSHTKNMSKIGEEKETTISSFYPPFFLSFLLSLVNSKMPTFAKLFFLQTSSSPPFLLFKKNKKRKIAPLFLLLTESSLLFFLSFDSPLFLLPPHFSNTSQPTFANLFLLSLHGFYSQMGGELHVIDSKWRHGQ